MLKNYFKIAWRSLTKSKGFTAINICGFSFGLAACMLIIFYVADELSYDRFHVNADRIYRVNEDLKLGENKVQYAVAMPPLAKTLKRDFPDVEDVARIKTAYLSIKKGKQYLIENNTVFADPSVFKVFTLPLIYGDKTSVLTQPNTVVISESAAKKYFNRINVVGEVLTTSNNTPLKITGVMEDMPQQSHFKADFLMAMVSFPESREDEWLRSNFNTYVLMRQGADYKDLEAQFPALLRKYSSAQMQKAVGSNMDDFEKKGNYFRLSLMPLTDIHLHSNLTGELGVNGNVQYVYIFTVIALFILLIACVNFINLSTARSSNRAREVGVRKVVGSSRKSLIVQFLLESVVVTFIATIIALIIVFIALPSFNNLSGKNISVDGDFIIRLLPILLSGILLIGIIAGLYPAFFLSSFQPIHVLKGKIQTGFKDSGLRSFLIVLQFSISIFLIISTLVIYHQLKYIQTRDVGFDRDQVLVLHNAFELGKQARTFKEEIKQLPGVKNVTLTGFLPTSGNRNSSVLCKDATRDPKKSIFPQNWRVDEDYIQTLGMKIVRGRNFSSSRPADSNALVINESAAKFLGFKDPINKALFKEDIKEPYTIIGVVKDFNFSSLRENVAPVVMTLSSDNGSIAVRVQTKNISALLAKFENKWKSLAPAGNFQYSFMDADFEAVYRTEQRMGQIFLLFTTLAIGIACLGLFGLSAYAAEQRRKEIGIRKVLGASIQSITTMLSKDFIKLVLLAILISSPIAWYATHKWLQDFAYRIDVAWWMFAAAGLGAIFIAMLTISFQAVKAAVANPVKSLRSE
ncbi:MAG: ABC transporter permease [Sphingobacteriaceae bacterium]|nr:ABC transporter permease [Sphingobacteriaceae bacterium]